MGLAITRLATPTRYADRRTIRSGGAQNGNGRAESKRTRQYQSRSCSHESPQNRPMPDYTKEEGGCRHQ